MSNKRVKVIQQTFLTFNWILTYHNGTDFIQGYRFRRQYYGKCIYIARRKIENVLYSMTAQTPAMPCLTLMMKSQTFDRIDILLIESIASVVSNIESCLN